MKLLSVAVPCYNSEGYMRHCIETLLTGGDEVEILIVDDGSKDATAAIADELERGNPGIVRAIHQPNKGHGGAVMTGLKNATGLYFKVVDSDDWVDVPSFKWAIERLRGFSQMDDPVDLLVCNYIYDKAGATHKKVIRYSALKENKVLTWDNVGSFRTGQYLLMHALIYRTEMLRNSALDLPEHTFYVDNLYAYTPLVSVKTLYYLNADLYHYFIGREDQSVQEKTMIKRIDQQLKVNEMMLSQVELDKIENKHQRKYLLSYLEIVTTISSVTLIRAGTPEALEKKKMLWDMIAEKYPYVYKRLRMRPMGVVMHLPGKSGRAFGSFCYDVSQRIFGFN